MKILPICLFLITGSYGYLVDILQCRNSTKCYCYDSYEPVEYQCHGTVIRLFASGTIQMQCNNEQEIGIDILPDLNLSSLNKMTIVDCPIVGNYMTILKKLNIQSIRSLRIENVASKNISINKDLFLGLENLERLALVNNQEINIASDFLAYTPNLIVLDLEKSKLDTGTLNLTFVPKLEYLGLSYSKLNNLEENIFSPLENLTILNCVNNNIKKVSSKVFELLPNLSILELRQNKINILEENSFIGLTKLVRINLRNNDIKNISRILFNNTSNLKEVNFGYNPNLSVQDFTFSNFFDLNYITLDNSNLNEVPENIFRGSNNIKRLLLNNNKLKNIPENLFFDLENLKDLNLSFNFIRSIPDKLLSSLSKLVNLNLKNNLLEELNENIFAKLFNLEKLDLSNNNIFMIQHFLFKNCGKLKILDLSYNRIKEITNPHLNNLQYINLAHNQINHVYAHDLRGMTKRFSVDLEYNQISYIDFSIMPENIENFETINVINIANNSLVCDCFNVYFIKHLQQNNNKKFIFLNTDEIMCTKPTKFSKTKVSKVKLNTIGCEIKNLTTYAECPERCDCLWKPVENVYEINCSFKNLTTYPVLRLPPKIKFGNQIFNVNAIEMNLKGNLLKTGPPSESGYENVTKLYLSNNEIEQFSWIPSKLKELYLDNNKLQNLNEEVLNAFKKSVYILSLHGNEWVCDCESLPLREFLIRYTKQIEQNNVVCNDTKIPITASKNICRTSKLILISSIIAITPLLTIAIVAALFYRFQNTIKIWLFSKNLCLWLVSEEELDKDKIYDVFISFSHKDEDFVMQNILSILESEPNPFKVCIHSRDFVPGENITTQIVKSVTESRRTLVILSNYFLESCWGKLEFRTAHTQAINEGRARVIIIILGDINEDKLDEELKVYLKTNTYVKWGDPWFWQKIKYALPHKKHNNDRFNQKHANMMLNIDDQFEIMKSVPKSDPLSTPPILALDVNFLNEQIYSQSTKLVNSHCDENSTQIVK